MMGKGRMEAFSDGVIAIIITIMVLEMKVPHGVELVQLKPLIPVFVSYCLSFVYIGIYWNNHHHMLQAVHSINGITLWANLHFLFWLSLIPFVTGWMGENHFAQWPVFLYGLVLLMNALAYSILSNILISHHGKKSELATAIGRGNKGKISIAIYVTAMILTLFNPWISFGLYVIVAVIWFLPDRRIEKKLMHDDLPPE
jgi:uncharacterized membrane protein